MENKLIGNTLFFSNKTSGDIIYEKELVYMLGDQVFFILTKENKPGYKNGYINEDFIGQNVTDFNTHFYVCGPDQMIAGVTGILAKLGAESDALVFEK